MAKKNRFFKFGKMFLNVDHVQAIDLEVENHKLDGRVEVILVTPGTSEARIVGFTGEVAKAAKEYFNVDSPEIVGLVEVGLVESYFEDQ